MPKKKSTFQELVVLSAQLLDIEPRQVIDAFCSKTGYSPKTLQGWLEKDIANFQESAMNVVRNHFVELFIHNLAWAFSRLYFYLIPSEITALWFVIGDQLVCPANSQYFALKDDNDSLHAAWLIPMSDEGLTALALHTKHPVRLHGAGIANHPAKRFKSRVNVFLAGNISHSLLRIPIFRNDSPIALLSAENKLDPQKADSVMGSESQRKQKMAVIYDNVTSKDLSLPEKLNSINTIIKKIPQDRFAPEDVINADAIDADPNPFRIQGEVFTEHDAELSMSLAAMVKRLIVDIFDFIPGGLKS